MDIVKFHQSQPKYGTRKTAEHYKSTKIQSILQHKDEIVSEREQKANANIKKKFWPAEFKNIKNAVWKWFCIAGEANVTLSGGSTTNSMQVRRRFQWVVAEMEEQV